MPVLSNRILRGLAWFFVGLFAILLTAGMGLQVLEGLPAHNTPWLATFMEAVYISVFAIVGALIVSRHPRHPIGWIWICLSIVAALDHFAWGYAYYGFVAHPGSLPGVGVFIVWMYLNVRATIGLLLITLLLLLFPTGRPLSRRWGLVAWIAFGVVSLGTLISALAPNLFGYFPFPTDLLFAGEPVRAVLGPLGMIANLTAAICVLAAAFSLFIRLRVARGVERQQIKWFVYAAAFFPPGVLVIILSTSSPGPYPNLTFLFGIGLTSIAFGGMSLASAIGIFRYRLWDVDIIIRRTLVYGLLTGLLLLIYLVSITLLQNLLATVTGQQSTVAIVLSTLAIAALFTPLRRRIQDTIDRRFYRRKYDAEKALAEFALTAREEVDLENLSLALLEVVDETIQPESASIWLRNVPE
jgi:hypothetical protein